MPTIEKHFRRAMLPDKALKRRDQIDQSHRFLLCERISFQLPRRSCSRRLGHLKPETPQHQNQIGRPIARRDVHLLQQRAVLVRCQPGAGRSTVPKDFVPDTPAHLAEPAGPQWYGRLRRCMLRVAPVIPRRSVVPTEARDHDVRLVTKSLRFKKPPSLKKRVTRHAGVDAFDGLTPELRTQFFLRPLHEALGVIDPVPKRAGISQEQNAQFVFRLAIGNATAFAQSLLVGN